MGFSIVTLRCSPHGFASGGIRKKAEKHNRAEIPNKAEKIRQGVQGGSSADLGAGRDPRGGAPGRPPQRTKPPLYGGARQG